MTVDPWCPDCHHQMPHPIPCDGDNGSYDGDPTCGCVRAAGTTEPPPRETLDTDRLRRAIRATFAQYEGVWTDRAEVRIVGDYSEATDHIVPKVVEFYGALAAPPDGREALRERVIEAARAWYRLEDDEIALWNAVYALDSQEYAVMTPLEEAQRDLIRDTFEVLDTYGGHIGGCEGADGPCRCGWREEIAHIRRRYEANRQQTRAAALAALDSQEPT